MMSTKREYSPLLTTDGSSSTSSSSSTSNNSDRATTAIPSYLIDNDDNVAALISRSPSFHLVRGDSGLPIVATQWNDINNQLKENEFAAANGLLRPKKTIRLFESFALISNNISGPAMMGLPHLFHVAGIVSVVVAIVLVFVGSSLVGTLLADAIASIPGNSDYNRHLSFSKAFKIVLGERWYILAESFFLVSCLVQACAAIVETAQSLDGFIASFVWGKTYGLQFLPTVGVVEWSGMECHQATTTQVRSFVCSGQWVGVLSVCRSVVSG